MDRENIEGLESHRIVAAQHVLVAKQVREISREGLADALVRDLGDESATVLESEQLLATATRNFAEKLVDGLEADGERIAAPR